MKCLCGCDQEVNEGRRYINAGHAMRGKTPWNKKYPDKWVCETCRIKFSHDGRKRRFCSPKCWGISKIGMSTWNKGLKGRQFWYNTKGLIKAKIGNTHGFQKGFIPKSAWKKGHKPWNYIDGRSKFLPPMRYGDDWEIIRLLIYKRDNYNCKDCGMTMSEHRDKFKQGLHIHHKIPFLISFDNSPKNLITLCKSCHSKEEMRLRKDYLNIGQVMVEELK